jgi:hypothetical protein
MDAAALIGLAVLFVLDGSASADDRRLLEGAAREQLKGARDGGHQLIRTAAEQLLARGQCGEP